MAIKKPEHFNNKFRGWYTIQKTGVPPSRRKILKMLQGKDHTAGEIADAFHISKPSISHHLDVLKRADLIRGERNG